MYRMLQIEMKHSMHESRRGPTLILPYFPVLQRLLIIALFVVVQHIPVFFPLSFLFLHLLSCPSLRLLLLSLEHLVRKLLPLYLLLSHFPPQ